MVYIDWPYGLLLLSCLTFGLARGFTFDWSTPTYQCYTQALTWTGGSPPFQAIITPALQMPFVYKIPDSSFNVSTNTGLYKIQLQLASGIQYVLWMSDSTGVGTGGSTPVLTVQGYSDSGCLQTAGYNATTLDFSFQTDADNPIQCEPSVKLDWTSTYRAQAAPYNMTVISADQSFDPYDVNFGNTSSVDWSPNIAAGKSFLLMMNDNLGYGYGGTSSVHTVNATETSDSSCLSGGGVTITPGVSHTATGTASASATASNGSYLDNSPPLSRAATIAIGVVGVLVCLGIGGATVYGCLVWRRRQSNRKEHGGSGGYPGKRGFWGIGNTQTKLAVNTDQVDLFDVHSSANGSDYDRQTPNSATYAPMPYTPSGESNRPWESDQYSSDHAQTMRDPLSSISPLRITTDTNVVAENYGHADNPFESGNSPYIEESLAALVDRKYPPRTQAIEREATEHRSPIDSRSRTGSPLLRRQGTLREETSDSDTQDRIPSGKEEEAWAEIARSRPPTSTTDNNTVSTRSTPLSSTVNVPSLGMFRVTNAGEGDPIVPPPPPSTHSSTGGMAGRGTTRRRRGADGFDLHQPRFVRHADAGRLPGGQEEVIDLPPLYTDLVLSPSPQNPTVGSPDSTSHR